MRLATGFASLLSSASPQLNLGRRDRVVPTQLLNLRTSTFHTRTRLFFDCPSEQIARAVRRVTILSQCVHNCAQSYSGLIPAVAQSD